MFVGDGFNWRSSTNSTLGCWLANSLTTQSTYSNGLEIFDAPRIRSVRFVVPVLCSSSLDRERLPPIDKLNSWLAACELVDFKLVTLTVSKCLTPRKREVQRVVPVDALAKVKSIISSNSSNVRFIVKLFNVTMSLVNEICILAVSARHYDWR